MINANEIGTTGVGHFCHLSPSTLEKIFRYIIAQWHECGISPDRVAVDAPGFSGKIVTYQGALGRIKKLDWRQVRSLSICKLDEDGVDAKHDYVVRFSVVAKSSYVCVTVLQNRISVSCGDVSDWIRQIFSAANPVYGYLFRQPMYKGPPHYTMGLHLASQRFHTERPQELRSNITHWSRDVARPAGHVMLRDVYLQNYLSESHLSAPIGLSAMTLREWIEQEPAGRGELSQFTDGLTQWLPPIDNIPVIREQLFRAGRLFYWRFCNPSNLVPGIGQVPEPYRRDLLEPWEETGPTPEIFTTEFYNDKDPSLTY